MQTQMVMTVIAPNDAGLPDRLTALIMNQRCRVLDSRLTLLGEWLSGCLLIEGSWDRLALLETALDGFCEQTGTRLEWQRSQPGTPTMAALPYVVDAIGLASADMVPNITHFLTMQGIRLRDLSTHSYVPSHGSETMMSLRALVDVPSALHLGQLKSDFFELCDRLNLDAVLEPDRGG